MVKSIKQILKEDPQQFSDGLVILEYKEERGCLRIKRYIDTNKLQFFYVLEYKAFKSEVWSLKYTDNIYKKYRIYNKKTVINNFKRMLKSFDSENFKISEYDKDRNY